MGGMTVLKRQSPPPPRVSLKGGEVQRLRDRMSNALSGITQTDNADATDNPNTLGETESAEPVDTYNPNRRNAMSQQAKKRRSDNSRLGS